MKQTEQQNNLQNAFGSLKLSADKETCNHEYKIINDFVKT